MASARFRLSAGDGRAFALEHRALTEREALPSSQERIEKAIGDTVGAWHSWAGQHGGYEGPWLELVKTSGRVLQGLTYYPTGAMVAAPTTSLPETVGGERNWDYRFTWLRDASLTLEALWVAACPDEAQRYFDFLATVGVSQVRRRTSMQIMYGIGGEHDLSERTIQHLSGWRHSHPVRVGNAAWDQDQIDVYGELLSAAHRFQDQIRNLDEPSRQFLVDAANAAAERWREKDHGIWELRDEPRHFLHSKLMCWVAVDRAIALAPLLRVSNDEEEQWRAMRERIREAILSRGWNEEAGAFTQAFDSNELDAAVLLMPIVGFLPASDPRMRATIEAVAARLTDKHGLVYRYRSPDGLLGEEGTFLLCTFWLAEALALAGEITRARQTFERAAAFANDIGLLSEEVDAATGELLGNFPQAFSHIGLVNAAWAIAQAESNS